MENRLSTRLSIRKRGSSGGHHQAMEIEDRFGHWRSERVGDLIWTLGAMAAEHVFYDQNTTGVGGDLGSATAPGGAHGRLPRHGAGADRPLRPDRGPRGARGGRGARDGALRAARLPADAPLGRRRDGRATRTARRSATATSAGSWPGCSGRRSWSPGTPMRLNREGTEHVAERLISAGELYGDDVTDLLDGAALRKPDDRRDRRGDVAGDLIPPPSPAGRPAPDPEHRSASPAAEPDAARGGGAAAPPGPSAFRARFGFVMGALAGCAVAAAVLLSCCSGDGQRAGSDEEGLARRLVAVAPHTAARSRARRRSPRTIQGNYKEREGQEARRRSGAGRSRSTRCRSRSRSRPGDDFTVVDGTRHPVHARRRRQGRRLQGTSRARSAGACCGARRSSCRCTRSATCPRSTMVVALLPPAAEGRAGAPEAQGRRGKGGAEGEPALPAAGDLLPARRPRKQLKGPLERARWRPSRRRSTALTAEEAKRVDRPHDVEPVRVRAPGQRQDGAPTSCSKAGTS